jgi:hypothetical protein
MENFFVKMNTGRVFVHTTEYIQGYHDKFHLQGNQRTKEVNLLGAAVARSSFFGAPLEYDHIVDVDPKEYFIGYTCNENKVTGERTQGVFIRVRDPNISEARVNELIEIAREKVTNAQSSIEYKGYAQEIGVPYNIE